VRAFSLTKAKLYSYNQRHQVTKEFSFGQINILRPITYNIIRFTHAQNWFCEYGLIRAEDINNINILFRNYVLSDIGP
jgi:hypothetical protein